MRKLVFLAVITEFRIYIFKRYIQKLHEVSNESAAPIPTNSQKLVVQAIVVVHRVVPSWNICHGRKRRWGQPRMPHPGSVLPPCVCVAEVRLLRTFWGIFARSALQAELFVAVGHAGFWWQGLHLEFPVCRLPCKTYSPSALGRQGCKICVCTCSLQIERLLGKPATVWIRPQ